MGLEGSIRRFGRRRPRFVQLQQIPKVTIEVLEDRDRAVGFVGRWPHKDHAPVLVRMVITPEILRVQEEEDAAAGLIPDASGLLSPDGTPQEEFRFR